MKRKDKDLENKKELIKDFYKDDISKIAKNAGISGLGEILGNIIGYASNVLVTRRIGPSSFGIYVLASTILRVVSIFSVAGLDNGLIRFIALYHGKGDRARLKGVILFGTQVVGLISLIFFLLLFFTSNFISTRIFHNPDLSFALMILLISLPFTNLMTIWLGGIQGFQLIKYRVYVEKLFQPISRLFFLILFFLLGMKLFGVLLASVLSIIIGFIIAFNYLNNISPFHKNSLTPIYENKTVVAFSLPLVFVTFFSFLIRWTDILMLGYFKTSLDVGIFGAADRVIPLVSLPLQSLNVIFSPMISELSGERDFSKLEGLFKVETKWAISLSFPIFLALSIFAHPVMNIFGDAFTVGATVLIILSAAQMIRVSVGSTGPMLMMTGHQNISLANTTIFAIANIILNYLLIPRYGIIGAAIASTISLIAINIVEVIQIYYLLKIHPFRSDLMKPLVAGVFSSLVTLFILRVEVIRINQYNIFCLGALILSFFALYLMSMIALRLSDEDRWIIDAIIRRIRLATEKNTDNKST
ncbi:MAG: flippase [Proteobacteria bacterium]|nr:flippase [Pseudomonadota bacterium]